MTTSCGHDISSHGKLVVLRNGVLGKCTVKINGNVLAALVADLVTVNIGVRIGRIGTNVCVAVHAGGSAIGSKLVVDAVKSFATVLASGGAGVIANVTCIGVLRFADVAVVGASIFVAVLKTGSRIANVADAAALGSGSNVITRSISYEAAFVTLSVAVTCIGVGNRLAFDHEILAAVLANNAACSLRRASSLSCAGGASCTGALGIASVIISMTGNGLAANNAFAVTVERLVVKAIVVADSIAHVAKEVSVFVNVRNCLGSAALVAFESVTRTVPNVLLTSVVSASVVADLVAVAIIYVEGANSFEAATVARKAASEFEIVILSFYLSGSAAELACNGAFLLVLMVYFTGSATVGARGGAGVRPSMSECGSRSLLEAKVTGLIASIVIGVCAGGSDIAANGTNGTAVSLVGVLQLRIRCTADFALTGATGFILVLKRLDVFGTASGANGVFTVVARVLGGRLSLNGEGTAVAERVAVGSVLMLFSTVASREHEECKGHSQN